MGGHHEAGRRAIEVVDEIGSTNAEMKRRGRVGAAHGEALRARVQTAGRGQRAHEWSSPDGGLYLSVLVRPEVPPAMLPGLPVACALGIVDAIRGAGCTAVRLKWPNDVVVGRSKLAGILVELGSSPEGTFAVCGVGVNMARPEVLCRGGAVAALAPVGLVDVMDAGVAVPSVDDLAEAVRDGILRAVDAWADAVARERQRDACAPLAPLLAAYNARLAFIGEAVTVFAFDGGIVDEGVLMGVDERGRALVRRVDGILAAHDSVDVSIRP